MLGEENSSPHAINAPASNHFSISLTTTCLILYGLNFTQTHYLIVASNLPYHTEPSLLAQATHHHAATCTVRKQFNYDDRWILRTLMMQERGFPSTSKAKDTASHLRADRDSDHDISRPQLCHLAVTPGYVTHVSLTYCQRG